MWKFNDFSITHFILSFFRGGLTPSQVICERTSPVDQDVKRKILDLLEDKVYIPVFRADDLSVPGFIGDPLSPADSKIETLNVSSPSAKNPLSNLLSPKVSPFKGTYTDSPMITVKKSFLESSPVTSPVAIRALMGPLSPKDAEKVRLEWKKVSPASKLIRLSDPDKGLERQGRDLAKKFGTQIKEFWPFLDAFCDITSEDGLRMLENHLHEQTVKIGQKQQKDLIDDLEFDLANLNLAEKSLEESVISDHKSHDDATNANEDNDLGLTNFLKNEDRNNTKSTSIWSENNRVENISSNELSHWDRWNRPRDDCNNDSLNLSDNIVIFQRSVSSDSENSSFVSAVSSLDESIFSAEEGSWIYINGSQPSKIDLHVYEALSQCIINPRKYPNIHTWKCLIDSTTIQERKHWAKERKNRKPFSTIPKILFTD